MPGAPSENEGADIVCSFFTLAPYPDQQDAYAAAAWLRRADLDGSLRGCLTPPMPPCQDPFARVEGWILGVL